MANVLKAKINGVWVEINSGSNIEIPKNTRLLKGDGVGGIMSAVADGDYQSPLVSGTNIKSINGMSILGSGNLIIGDASISVLKYGDSIKKPFDFSNKTIRFFGDSITAGVISGNESGVRYSTLFCQQVNATEINDAVSGSSTAARDGVSNSVYDLINRLSAVEADFIIIAGGTNDYYFQIPMGTFNDTNATTFCGALNLICEKLTAIAPTVPVIFITPINKPVAPTAIEKVYGLDDYRNAIFEVAVSHGYSVINGASLGFPTKHGNNLNAFSYKVIYDGVHPSATGHRMYANSLCGKLL